MAESIQDYIVKHVFDAGGHTGKNYYYRITDRFQTQIWNNAVKALVPISSITYAAGCIGILEQEDSTGAGVGVYRIIMFAALDGGTYNITVHERAGATPVPEDDISEHWQQKHGSIFGF